MANTGRTIALFALAAALSAPAHAQEGVAAPVPASVVGQRWAEAQKRAQATLDQMTPEEKTVLVHGQLAVPIMGPLNLPADAVIGAGYVHGVPRLGVPSLRETDASLGVAWLMGLRKDGATALPSAVAMAASWNPQMVEVAGGMIGGEARAKGFNVMLAGGVNLLRDPRNGRTFEYFSEDPLLSGVLVGHAIRGIQSNGIISTIKHFAVNDQESGRYFLDAHISEKAARESDLLAFRIGMEIGDPASVMCAYNKVNGAYACDNDWLLNSVLKQDWGFKGFVMSDWGAVPGTQAAIHGLDQQSGEQMDKKPWFAAPLTEKAAADTAYSIRVDDMNRRILSAIYARGLDKPFTASGAIDFERNLKVSLDVAQQGIVLLRNERGVLPLAASAKSIAVIGGFADSGVLSGAGSSQVHGKEGPSVSLSMGGSGPFSGLIAEQYQGKPPLDAIKARAKGAAVQFRDSRYISNAVAIARQSEVAIVFATQWMTEGKDVPDLGLPNGQDALIAAVAEANPNTIVVLQTGGPVQMPWLAKAAAVIEAWYPGAAGGEAIASVLFGEVNPSGRLPMTFPSGVDELPRPRLDGIELDGNITPGTDLSQRQLAVNYDIEGSDVGYRWNALHGHKALFPFGYGLSYTRFRTGDLKVNGDAATLTVTNTGSRSGATVAQVYLVSRNGMAKRRLVGFQRVEIAAGRSVKVKIAIDPRLLADWGGGGWSMPKGAYVFASGDNAEALGDTVSLYLPARQWRDRPLAQ